MSTYYEFYAAVEKDGKIEAIGPYIRKDGGYRLIPILSRSRSFIQWDDFGYWNLPIEKMAEDQIEFFTDTGWISDERQSISYYIPYKDIAALADDGLIQGYVTLDELNMVSAAQYSQDALWDIWVKTPGVAAEMDPETRKQYGHIAYIDRCSTGYICSQLVNTNSLFTYGHFIYDKLSEFVKETGMLIGVVGDYKDAPKSVQNIKKDHPDYPADKLPPGKFKVNMEMNGFEMQEMKVVGSTHGNEMHFPRNEVGEQVSMLGYTAIRRR